MLSDIFKTVRLHVEEAVVVAWYCFVDLGCLEFVVLLLRVIPRFLRPTELAATMGMGCMDFRGLTESQSSAILGKSMATTSLVIVLLSLLKCLEMCQAKHSD